MEASADYTAAAAAPPLPTSTFPFLQLPELVQLEIFDNLCRGPDDESRERKCARMYFLCSCKDVYNLCATSFYRKAVFKSCPESLFRCVLRFKNLAFLHNLRYVRIRCYEAVWEPDLNVHRLLEKYEMFLPALSMVSATRLPALEKIELSFDILAEERGSRGDRSEEKWADDEKKYDNPPADKNIAKEMENFSFWWQEVDEGSKQLFTMLEKACSDDIFPDFKFDHRVKLTIRSNGKEQEMFIEDGAKIPDHVDWA